MIDSLVYTVSQINNYSSQLLGKSLSNVWVAGEISSIKSYPSGYTYLTLRDVHCELSCIAPYNIVKGITKGMEVNVNGDISIYSIKGTYQLRIKSIDFKGTGNLWEMYLQLKESLEKEGLFLKAHKKHIPSMPKKIGILSSLEGAVVHDICNILKRRSPYVNIIVKDTKVNGIKSSDDLIINFNHLASWCDIDVIIIARGGGSFEDLSCFNNETLVRNIFNCDIPVISAIGHETDYVLCDFVSDLRASTPSEAAELVSIDINDLKQNLSNIIDKINSLVLRKVDNYDLLLSNYSKIVKSTNLKHIIVNKCNNVDYIMNVIYNTIIAKIEKYSSKIKYNKSIIKNNDIEKIKRMGFSIVRKNDTIINDLKKININDIIDIDMANGSLNTKVRKIYEK